MITKSVEELNARRRVCLKRKRLMQAMLTECGIEVDFGNGLIEMIGERVRNWKQAWRKLKQVVKVGAKEKGKESFE